MKEITPKDSIVPVYLVPLTPEEEAEREQRAKEDSERKAAEQAKVEAKESALAKLSALGLTEKEIQAIVGSQ
jgi:hypothetical protein